MQCSDQDQEKHNKDSVTRERSGKGIVHGKLLPLESERGVECGDGGEDGRGREVRGAGQVGGVGEVERVGRVGEHREYRKGKTHPKGGKSKEIKSLSVLAVVTTERSERVQSPMIFVAKIFEIHTQANVWIETQIAAT